VYPYRKNLLIGEREPAAECVAGRGQLPKFAPCKVSQGGGRRWSEVGGEPEGAGGTLQGGSVQAAAF
jgi:hypothetical protein